LLGKARRQVDRLGRLVEDLLDVSRLESHRMQFSRERFNLDDLAEEVVSDFRAQARNHEIVFHRSPQSATVEGDRPRIAQVLVNLLSNALKYSPQGGQISVRVETRPNEVWVSVRDPGIGIPRSDQDRLFERF